MKSSRLFLKLQADSRLDPARATISLRDVMAKPASLAKQSPDLQQRRAALRSIF
jgi:hypothetical protein